MAANQATLTRGGKFPWGIILFMALLISGAIAISHVVSQDPLQCSFLGCKEEGVVPMKSTISNQIGIFCEPHAVMKESHGWVRVGQ